MSRIECRIKFPQNQRCRAKIAQHAPKLRCRTLLQTPLSHFPLIRSRQGARRAGGGYRGTLGSENGSRYRGVSQLQSHQSSYSVQLSMGYRSDSIAVSRDMGPLSKGRSIPLHPENFGLPRKQKIAVNKFWVQESEIGEACRQFRT